VQHPPTSSAITRDVAAHALAIWSQQVDKPGRAKIICKLIRKMKTAEKLARQKKVQG
jgi:hypothetical protein